jgi:hypothetical protein
VLPHIKRKGPKTNAPDRLRLRSGASGFSLKFRACGAALRVHSEPVAAAVAVVAMTAEVRREVRSAAAPAAAQRAEVPHAAVQPGVLPGVAPRDVALHGAALHGAALHGAAPRGAAPPGVARHDAAPHAARSGGAESVAPGARPCADRLRAQSVERAAALKCVCRPADHDAQGDRAHPRAGHDGRRRRRCPGHHGQHHHHPHCGRAR